MPTGKLAKISVGMAILAGILTVFVFSPPQLHLPHGDQVSMAALFGQYYEGSLSIGGFWEGWQGHRPFFPRVLMFLVGLTNHWNIPFQNTLPLILGAAFCGLISVLCARVLAESGLPTAASFLLFVVLLVLSLDQFNNWLNGWQTSVFLNVICAASALFLLAYQPPTPRVVAAVIALATVASCSFGNGLALWPIAVVATLWRSSKNSRVALVYALAGGAVAALYFADLDTSFRAATLEQTVAAAQFSNLGQKLAAATAYALTYLGGGLFGINGAQATFLAEWQRSLLGLVAPTLGFAGLVFFACAAVAIRRAKRLTAAGWIFACSLGAYAILSAGVTAVGRYRFGAIQAINSHYYTISHLFWIANAVLFLALCRQWPRPRRLATTAFTRGVVAATFACALASYLNGARHFIHERRVRAALEERLLTAYGPVQLEQLGAGADVEQVRALVRLLEKYKLCIYRTRPPGAYLPEPE